jgi:glycosyltransferase involved in cell wall biosynthesis
MEQAYVKRYGARGTVLYPSRAKNCIAYESPPERLRQRSAQFTMVYAGNIITSGYWKALRRVAEALLPLGGRLIVYSPHTREQARVKGLTIENVDCRGFIKSEELVDRLRAEADVLFVPMSFDTADRPNMEVGFPSKLTDATIPGVPLLIFGPDYCSAVRWASENPGVAEVVSREDSGLLAAALQRLTEPAHRWRLGEVARLKGKEFFSHSVAERILQKVLTIGSSLGVGGPSPS